MPATKKRPVKPPQEKQAPKPSKTVKVSLPEHINLSEDELLVVSRFVRLRRFKAYWLPRFIECLIEMDFAQDDSTSGISPYDKTIEELLEHFQRSHTLKNFNKLKAFKGILFTHLRDVYSNAPLTPLDDSGDLVEKGEFYELVRLWRLEHPEPEKRLQMPQGHLGRKDDDD